MSPDRSAPHAAALTESENHRRHARAPLALFGACRLAGTAEFACHTRDISASGAALHAPMRANTGTSATLRLDRLGTLEGRVVRCFPGGFAIEFTIGPKARERLAEQIAWMSTRSSIGLIEDARFAPARACATTSLHSLEKESQVGVIDVSRTGIAIRTFEHMQPGFRVTIGRTSGRVLRVFEGGAAIEFLEPVKRLPCGAVDF